MHCTGNCVFVMSKIRSQASRGCYVVFSHKKKTYEINAFITVKVFGGISFHVMAENWQYLKDTLAFLLESKLTSDLLPNISLVVGQSSVHISLVLRVREISTSLTSNQ